MHLKPLSAASVIRAHDSAAGPAPAARPPAVRIKSLRRLEDTVIRVGGIGDNWHMSWAADDKQYVSLCDGMGLPGTPQKPYNSRMYAIRGTLPELTFEELPGYPELLNKSGKEVSRYYNFGTLALDGRLYQFLSTPNCTFNEPQPRFVGAKLVYSPDGGKTWHNQDGSTPVRWELWEDRSRRNMVFFEEPGDAFALITVLQMGRNYEHNRDGFVYLYAPNGNTEGTMNQVVLCRMTKDRILDRAAYEYFAGAGAGGAAQWSKRIEDRSPVYTFPPGWVNRNVHPYSWHPCVVYYAPTGQYLMANWGMATDATGDWFVRPSYLGFWTAPAPWGPWTQVYEEQEWTPDRDRNARAYQAQIAPKWIAADGRSFWLVWTDFQDVAGRGKPYYSFNVQKVEVELAPAQG